MEITVDMIRELREATGSGVLDAKKALEAADGDFEKAMATLRKKGLARAEKRSGREANEGVIEVYSHLANRVGVMVEVNCETDFVARNERFQEMAHDLALHVAAMAPRYVSREDVPADVLEEELSGLRAEAEAEDKPENIVEKMVQGRMEKFYERTVLLEQPFVKDDSITVEEMVNNTVAVLGENIVVSRFVRYELGEEF